MKQKSEIDINVYGVKGVGKSTIIYAIANALESLGIEVAINKKCGDMGDYDTDWILKNKDRIENIKDNICVCMMEYTMDDEK